MPRLIDLSMEVFQGMMTYPNVAKPVIVEMESYRDMARSVGTDKYGIDEITNHCMIVTGDHIGTHIDSWGHVKPDAPRAEGIPIEYCYGDGVVLDLTFRGPGDEITVPDIERAEQALAPYEIKPRDIVLLRTDAAKQRLDKAQVEDGPESAKASKWKKRLAGLQDERNQALARMEELSRIGLKPAPAEAPTKS